MKKKTSEVCYRYKDGRYLKMYPMGDGEYELILTDIIIGDCLFPIDWALSEILNCCDGVYDDSGEHIADTLDEADFVMQNAEVKIDIK